MTVAKGGHRDAGAEIEILPPIGVPHADSVAAHEADRRTAAVVRGVVGGRPFQERLGIHGVRPGRQRTISVPMPSRVNSSSKIACGTRPSMMCALAVPPLSARSDDST